MHAEVEANKRLTIDVTENLHKRIKAQCAMRGTKMADVIRELLEKEFAA
nr:plasmid partition protein ParG [Rhizobium metallidurans]